jgi:hypothetical protein
MFHQVTSYMRWSLLSKITNGLAWRADRVLRPLAYRHYPLARRYELATLAVSRWTCPVLVYTMGKVGSSSLARSLEKAAPEFDVLHFHRLVPERLARADDLYREAARRHGGTPAAQMGRARHVWLGQYLSRRIDRGPPGGNRWTVITLIRDPVARNTSSFFQNLFFRVGYDWAEQLQSKSLDAVVADLGRLFLDSYAREDWWALSKDENFLTWFDDELRQTFGIDVLAEPFPTDIGFKIYEGPRARVLLIRLEDLDGCAPAAMQAFLGLPAFELQRRNVAAGKRYASLYRRFVESVELPAEYVDRLYGSRVARHFYTERELESFRNRALRQDGPGGPAETPS